VGDCNWWIMLELFSGVNQVQTLQQRLIQHDWLSKMTVISATMVKTMLASGAQIHRQLTLFHRCQLWALRLEMSLAYPLPVLKVLRLRRQSPMMGLSLWRISILFHGAKLSRIRQLGTSLLILLLEQRFLLMRLLQVLRSLLVLLLVIVPLQQQRLISPIQLQKKLMWLFLQAK